MTPADWLREFKDELENRLFVKTNWGRVEVKNEIREAYEKILIKMIGHKDDKTS